MQRITLQEHCRFDWKHWILDTLSIYPWGLGVGGHYVWYLVIDVVLMGLGGANGRGGS